jgi:predicted ABC-type ATPase
MELHTVDAQRGDGSETPVADGAGADGEGADGAVGGAVGGAAGAGGADQRREQVTEVKPGLPRPPESAADRERQRWVERLERAANPGSDRDKLRERMYKIEPGHPSSPWDENGEPRPAETRPSDLERPEAPLSDADYAAHVSEVVKCLDEALSAGLTTDKLYTIDPDRGIWTEDRADFHNEIIESAYSAAASVPCEHKAIIAGGLGGAGKTTLLDQQAGIDLSAYLMINPDTFKEELARRGLTPKIAGLSPMETSALAHEESSYLARQLALRALADGKNIIWDITMSSAASTGNRISELRSQNYQQIEGVFVDIPIETSISRTGDRHRHGHDRFLAGNGYGGRYIPADVIRSQADPDYGSINRRAFETLKTEFNSWIIYDNSVRGRPAAVVERGGLHRPEEKEQG